MKYAGVNLPKGAIELEAKKLAIQALESYDPNFGTQINTHVINYLKKLQRFVITYQNVAHIPEPRAIAIGKYQTIYENIESEKGREPTIHELSDAMNWAPIEVERLQSEQRKDLSITADTDDESSGFYYFQNPWDEDNANLQAIQFVYFDSDPIDKKIMEYTFPDLGKYEKSFTKKDIALKLNLSAQEVRKRQKAIAEKLKEVLI